MTTTTTDLTEWHDTALEAIAAEAADARS